MKKWLNLSVVFCLCSVLGFGPVTTLASGGQRASGKSINPAVSHYASGDANRPANAPPSSANEAKKRSQETAPNGQSSTLLPDGKLLLIGGHAADGPVTTIAIKDPRTDKVIEFSSQLRYPRAWHTATLLPDGTVLILGGVDADGRVVAQAEIANLETRNLESLPPRTFTPRAHHTATLLTNGFVLIAGGLSKSGNALKTAELWDSRTGTVRKAKAKLTTARSSHTATLLANGEVLLWGGRDKDGAILSNGEMYTAPEVSKQGTTVSERFAPADSLSNELIGDTPRLVGSLPENGTVNVPTNSLIALRFSKRLRVEKITNDSIVLTGPYGPVEGKVVPGEAGMLAFVTPNSPLLPGTTYTLEVSGATDTVGEVLSPASISFTTLGLPVPIEWPDDEEWIPNDQNPQDGWKTRRERSPWQSLPALQARPGVTALSGQVLRLNGRPLASVTLKVGDKSVQSDHTGRFLLTDIEAGRHELEIEGESANRPGRTYGFFEFGLTVTAAKTNVLPFTIWMPKLDMARAVTIPSRYGLTHIPR